jgi:hypothetical protein
MDKKEFIEGLGFTTEGHYENGEDKYVVVLGDSEEYAKAYTTLSNSLSLDETLTLVTSRVSELLFFDENYDVKLVANFDKDIYKVIVLDNAETEEDA